MDSKQTLVNISADIKKEADARADQYVRDNIQNPTPLDYLHAENLFLMGMLYGIEFQGRL